MKEIIIEKKQYKCEICGNTYNTSDMAIHCEQTHEKIAKYKLGDVVLIKREFYQNSLCKELNILGKIISIIPCVHQRRQYIFSPLSTQDKQKCILATDHGTLNLGKQDDSDNFYFMSNADTELFKTAEQCKKEIDAIGELQKSIAKNLCGSASYQSKWNEKGEYVLEITNYS